MQLSDATSLEHTKIHIYIHIYIFLLFYLHFCFGYFFTLFFLLFKKILHFSLFVLFLIKLFNICFFNLFFIFNLFWYIYIFPLFWKLFFFLHVLHFLLTKVFVYFYVGMISQSGMGSGCSTNEKVSENFSSLNPVFKERPFERLMSVGWLWNPEFIRWHLRLCSIFLPPADVLLKFWHLNVSSCLLETFRRLS